MIEQLRNKTREQWVAIFALYKALNAPRRVAATIVAQSFAAHDWPADCRATKMLREDILAALEAVYGPETLEDVV